MTFSNRPFYIVALVLFIFFVINFMDKTFQGSANANCTRIDEFEEAAKYVRSNLKSCMYSDRNALKDGEKFIKHMSHCILRHTPTDIQDFSVYERYSWRVHIDERTWFLPMVEESPADKSNCTWLTVGIGGALGNGAQHQAWMDYPECRFFGIEAENTSYGNFSAYGTIIPHAVGLEDGFLQTNIIKNTWTHMTERREIRALHKLLDEYVGSRFIHFTTFDIEGHEKILIDGLPHNGLLAKAGVSFCQVDWELHYEEKYEKIGLKSDRIDTMIRLVENSPYIPILISPMSDFNQYHITLLNIENPECVKPFRLKQIFTKRPLC